MGKNGYSLVELLTVVTIIGILAAVAIPTFTSYRARAYCSAQVSDLGSISSLQEAYFADHEKYTAKVADLQGFTPSAGVTITLKAFPTYFTASATHDRCNHGPSYWDSSKGGLQS